MPAIRKFTFNEEFDPRPSTSEPEPVVEEAAEPEPPPPTFSEAELAQARADAHAQGLAEGRAAAAREHETALETRMAALLESLCGQIEQTRGATAPLLQAIENRATALALGVVARVGPHLERTGFQTLCESLIDEAMSRLLNEPRMVIRLNPARVDDLRANLTGALEARGYGGQITYLGDEALAETDCRIEWADGGCEYSSTALWAEIGRIITALLPPDGADHAGPDGAQPSATTH